MKRKTLSEVSKRIIAAGQKYMCVGSVCNGRVLLPQTWELDHIYPLHLGGTNHINNLQVLCPNCHALKTQQEAMTRMNIIIRSPYFIRGHDKFLEHFRYYVGRRYGDKNTE